MIWIIVIGFMLVGFLVQRRLKSKFQKYSKIELSTGLSGSEIAQKMLNDHGITDVEVICTEGQLTDHYNPSKRTINLSHDVYHQRNVSAAAVAAHETGHAVQHANAYAMLSLRSAIVPLASFSSKLMNIIFIAGMFFSFVFHMISIQQVLFIILISQGIITLFSLITLQVEFDASDRALSWLGASGITNGEEYNQAKDALKWAAMTYLVAALAAMTYLAYYLAMFMGNRD